VGTAELSEYCREVEDHLTRVNGGHLVRIVGTGFELVRQWAEQGIPLSVVCRGIELKAERHRLGASHRPLRIEFCEADVRALYESWGRAVGLRRERGEGDEPAGADEAPRKRPSLSKHLERAIDRLGRVAGRLDLPDTFLATVSGVLDELAAMREETKGVRGEARAQAAARLAALDARVMASARACLPPAALESLAAEAASELAAFRDRLTGVRWQQAVDVTVDRLLRTRYGLPALEE
jgi:hypothetical protein